MMYNHAIRKRFDNPQHVGVLAANDDGTRVARGQAGIPGRTNVVMWHLRADAADKIVEAKYQVYGCGVAIAACEWTASQVQGKTLGEVLALPVWEIIDALAIDTMKHHCALLVKEAIEDAIVIPGLTRDLSAVREIPGQARDDKTRILNYPNVSE